MASSPAAPAFSLADLYLSHPHVLTAILYACSPTTFDALRYTCKAIYSMSLDPVLLEHHLTTIVDRQRTIIATHPGAKPMPTIDSKYDTLRNASGNLWRLRGLLLQELLCMKSSWRVGDSRKTVLALDDPDDDTGFSFGDDDDDPLFDGTMHIAIGPVRGETLALSWSDKHCVRLHTYRFAPSHSRSLYHIADTDRLVITHQFNSSTYLNSAYRTPGIGKHPHCLLFKATADSPTPLSIYISEGQYKRHPGLTDKEYSYHQPWYGWRGDEKELTTTLLRVKFHGRYFHEVAQPHMNSDIDLAYELHWTEKRKWRMPAVNLQNAPNTVLSDHAEETMQLLLRKDGRCMGRGYAVGLDDEPTVGADGGASERNRKWKVLEPRRLEQDISRMGGLWRDMHVVFSRDQGTAEVKGVIARSLVFRPPAQRFLLTRPSSTAKDWIHVEMSLVLPPTTHGEKRGKLVLATPAPAAYFRKLGLRDPEIPWKDPGMINYDWEPRKTSDTTGEEPATLDFNGATTGTQPMYIRTGCMLHQNMVDAEVLLRVVGYTDDSAVWVWDVTEKDILDCGELVGNDGPAKESPVARMEVVGKKLGYVEGVRGIAVTGDRLVERVFLFTWGKEGRVHRGGKMADDGEGIDAGIAELRREDLVRQLQQARQRNDRSRYIYYGPGGSGYTDEANDVELKEEEEEEEGVDGEKEKDQWRIVTYSFGDQKGGTGGFTMDSSGALEERW
ncbi:hypothetical protein Dda_5342 [Drechslerella dactyloides]|uniref:Uncharacterized protein n=1 Tax=Drechslerella dactyloides TaxID=74499 RepID=A0AAD6NIL5_DREDA|nr:hypothetical protein Dda_5342 [Drechslerella dactyloides]